MPLGKQRAAFLLALAANLVLANPVTRTKIIPIAGRKYAAALLAGLTAGSEFTGIKDLTSCSAKCEANDCKAFEYSADIASCTMLSGTLDTDVPADTAGGTRNIFIDEMTGNTPRYL